MVKTSEAQKRRIYIVKSPAVQKYLIYTPRLAKWLRRCHDCAYIFCRQPKYGHKAVYQLLVCGSSMVLEDQYQDAWLLDSNNTFPGQCRGFAY